MRHARSARSTAGRKARQVTNFLGITTKSKSPTKSVPVPAMIVVNNIGAAAELRRFQNAQLKKQLLEQQLRKNLDAFTYLSRLPLRNLPALRNTLRRKPSGGFQRELRKQGLQHIYAGTAAEGLLPIVKPMDSPDPMFIISPSGFRRRN